MEQVTRDRASGADGVALQPTLPPPRGCVPPPAAAGPGPPVPLPRSSSPRSFKLFKKKKRKGEKKFCEPTAAEKLSRRRMRPQPTYCSLGWILKPYGSEQGTPAQARGGCGANELPVLSASLGALLTSSPDPAEPHIRGLVRDPVNTSCFRRALPHTPHPLPPSPADGVHVRVSVPLSATRTAGDCAGAGVTHTQ